jgi:signal transduction histidine kinase
MRADRSCTASRSSSTRWCIRPSSRCSRSRLQRASSSGSRAAGAVNGDPGRLAQALTNLVENAIKFTPTGGAIDVHLWRETREVGVTVRDNGIGIPRHAVDHVFDRFYRADPSRSRESGGSGLGLAICYEVATSHCGHIWVDSDEGRGSAFSIALPAIGASQQPAPPAVADAR